jgi:aryl carrier-like protein
MLISVDAAWFGDLVDSHTGDGDDACDEIRARRASGGGAARSGRASSAPSAATSACCASWALVGARARVITQAAIDLEVYVPPQLTLTSPPQAAASPRRTSGNQMTLTVLRWISSVVMSASSRGRGATDTGQPGGQHDNDDEELDATERREAEEAAAVAAAMLAEILVVLNASPRPDDSDPIHLGTNLMDAGFDSLQVMELRRQLEGAGPAGCVLTATAVMEHSTPSALVKHMMMWHKPSAGGDTARRRGGESAGQSEETGRRQQLSSSARRGDIGVGVGVGVGSGDQARMTLVLFGSCVVMLLLLMMCFVLAVALYLARREVGVAQMAAVLEASRREGNDDGSTPTCVHD